jgi:hypothetical protein
LTALVGIALLAPIRGATLLGLPLIDYVIDGFHPPCRLLPTLLLGIAFGTRPLHHGLLLANRFAEPTQKRLIVAQLSDAQAPAGTLREAFFVLTEIALELGQLVLCIAQAALEASNALRQTLLGRLDHTLDRRKTLGAAHKDSPEDFP